MDDDEREMREMGVRTTRDVSSDDLTDLLARAIRPALGAPPPTADALRAAIRKSLESQVLEPPVFYVHPHAWDDYAAGRCTCRWVVPWPCPVHAGKR